LISLSCLTCDRLVDFSLLPHPGNHHPCKLAIRTRFAEISSLIDSKHIHTTKSPTRKSNTEYASIFSTSPCPRYGSPQFTKKGDQLVALATGEK